MVPEGRVVPRQQRRLAEVRCLLHPGAAHAGPHHPRGRGSHVPLPLLVLLVLDLEALVLDLRGWFRVPPMFVCTGPRIIPPVRLLPALRDPTSGNPPPFFLRSLQYEKSHKPLDACTIKQRRDQEGACMSPA